MRIASLTLPLLLLCFGSCSLFSSADQSEYSQPNSLMADEIENRVQQIPFQHRDELLQNLLWLAQTGESTIPTLLKGLQHENAKVRSSCAWVLGRIHDRRAIPQLQAAQNDTNETVRLEVSRTLVVLGDLKPAPKLIEGLDSERKEVRFLCHEALKAATGRDFGFDHLSENDSQRRISVLGWRQWWSEYSGDTFFATNYQQRYQIDPTAQPMGETQNNQQNQQNQNNDAWGQPQDPMQQEPQGQQPQQPAPNNGTPNGGTPTGDTPTGDTPTGDTPTGDTPNGGTPGNGTPTGNTPTGGSPTGGEHGTPTGGQTGRGDGN